MIGEGHPKIKKTVFRMEVFIMKALKKWFPLISLICGIVGAVVILMPCVKATGFKASGIQVCFGDDKKGLAFSFANIFAYLLAILAGLNAWLGAKKNNKINKYVALGCFVLAAIFFFLATNTVQWKGVPAAFEKELNKALDIAIGSILGALACIVGAVSTACDTFIKD